MLSNLLCFCDVVVYFYIKNLLIFFSPLGKVAGRAIYFTDVFSLFFFLFFF